MEALTVKNLSEAQEFSSGFCLFYTSDYLFVRTASPFITSLKLSRTMTWETFGRSNDEAIWITGLTGGAAVSELFLADEVNNVVLSLDVQSAILEDVYRPENGERISGVAYSSESDTLFVATKRQSTVSVRSFSRANITFRQWNENHRIQFSEERKGLAILRVLGDGTLICGQNHQNAVRMCKVHSNRSMLNCKYLTLPIIYWGFDLQLSGNEKRLAAILENGSLALFRMEAEGFAQMSHFPLDGARNILLYFDNLLVTRWNQSYDSFEILSFAITGGSGSLQHLRNLITHDKHIDIQGWCFTNEKLFAWDLISNELLLYNIK